MKVGAPNGQNGRSHFCDNAVVNSKYTIISFVPRSLFEQFRRLANVYFLLMVSPRRVLAWLWSGHGLIRGTWQGGLMLLGTYSTVFVTPLGALTTLFPLCIVLFISMCQEGLADIKRHRADDEVSYTELRSPVGRHVGYWPPSVVPDDLYSV
jgi:hypothetical protein